MYDYENRAGYLYDKINNSKRGKAIAIQCPESLSEQEVKAILDFFRHCVVVSQENEIKRKLKDTVKIRFQLVSFAGENFKQIFEFYYVAPHLVCIPLLIFFKLSKVI